MSIRASSISVCGGLTTNEACPRERLLAMRADRPGAYVQFEPQDVGHGQRGD